MPKLTFSLDSRINIYGSKKQRENAETTLRERLPLELGMMDITKAHEGEARLAIQKIIDTYKLKADILFDGNTVWSFNRIIRDIKRVKNNGMGKLTNYLYNFLHLSCGSIAHYNKQGWISKYPTISDLIEFFRSNEFGNRVLDHLPSWKTDTKRIVTEIERILGVNEQHTGVKIYIGILNERTAKQPIHTVATPETAMEVGKEVSRWFDTQDTFFNGKKMWDVWKTLCMLGKFEALCKGEALGDIKSETVAVFKDGGRGEPYQFYMQRVTK